MSFAHCRPITEVSGLLLAGAHCRLFVIACGCSCSVVGPEMLVTTLDRCPTTQHGSASHLMFVRQCQTCAFDNRAERALWPTPRQTNSWPHHVKMHDKSTVGTFPKVMLFRKQYKTTQEYVFLDTKRTRFCFGTSQGFATAIGVRQSKERCSTRRLRRNVALERFAER